MSRAVSVLAETVVEGNEATSLDSRSLPPTPARTMEPLTERTSSRDGIMAFSVCSIRTVEEDSEPAEESEAAEESEVAEESAGTITRAEAAEGSDLLEATEFTGEMQALPRELLVHILGQHCACRDLSALAVCREWRFVAQDVYEAHARRRYPPATIAAAQRSGSFLPGNLKRGWRALLASDNAAGGLVDPLNHTIPRGRRERELFVRLVRPTLVTPPRAQAACGRSRSTASPRGGSTRAGQWAAPRRPTTRRGCSSPAHLPR